MSDYVHRKPPVDIQKGALMLLIGTLFVGQIEILTALGVFGNVKSVYQSTAWFIPVYWLWPQIEYGIIECGYMVKRGITSNE